MVRALARPSAKHATCVRPPPTFVSRSYTTTFDCSSTSASRRRSGLASRQRTPQEWAMSGMGKGLSMNTLTTCGLEG